MATIEESVKELLTMDVSARAFSDALFGPTGLFNQMAHTEEERRRLTETALFHQANSRLTALLRLEASEAREEFERRLKKRRHVARNDQKKMRLSGHATPPIQLRPKGPSIPIKKHRKSG